MFTKIFLVLKGPFAAHKCRKDVFVNFKNMSVFEVYDCFFSCRFLGITEMLLKACVTIILHRNFANLSFISEDVPVIIYSVLLILLRLYSIIKIQIALILPWNKTYIRYDDRLRRGEGMCGPRVRCYIHSYIFCSKF